MWSQRIQLGCYRSGPGNDDIGVDLNGGNETGEKETMMEYMVKVESVGLGTDLMGKEGVLG